MKNFIGIITIMVLFFSTPTLGQTTFAIRSGVTMTKLNGDVGIFGQARKGIKIGASVTIPIQRRLGLQISGDYVQKGGNTLSFYEDEKTHIDYIEFSGMANFMLIAPHRLPTFSILIGITAAFKVRSKGTETFARRYGTDLFEFNILDFGIAGGVGTQMAISKTVTFNAELVFTHGLSDINKIPIYGSKNGIPAKVNLTNQEISLCVAISFPLSGGK